MQINNYLHFNGNCKEAMDFYASIFGGEVEAQKVGDSPAAQMPGADPNKIMHSTLKGGKIVLMGSDMFEGSTNTGNVSLTLISDNVDELKEMFSKLAVGGKVHQELQSVFFGTYGDLVDKFGIPWMFQSDQKM